MSSSYKTLNVTAGPDGHVVTVELNRPEAFNAMTTAMGEELIHCFDALARDRAVRAVIFTGAGEKAFCSGGDLKERNGMSDRLARPARDLRDLRGAGRHCPCPSSQTGGCLRRRDLRCVDSGGVREQRVGGPRGSRHLPGDWRTQLLPRIVERDGQGNIFTGSRVMPGRQGHRLVNTRPPRASRARRSRSPPSHAPVTSP